jgi:hypothetical protein
MSAIVIGSTEKLSWIVQTAHWSSCELGSNVIDIPRIGGISSIIRTSSSLEITGKLKSLDMTLVSNDPSWWPQIDLNLTSSYVTGSWRASRTMKISHTIFDCGPCSRLHYCAIIRLGWANNPFRGDCLNDDVPMICLSTDIRTRGWLVHYWSSHFTKNDFIARISLGEQHPPWGG